MWIRRAAHLLLLASLALSPFLALPARAQECDDDDAPVRERAAGSLEATLTAEDLKAILAEHLTAKSCILYDPETRKILYSRSPFQEMAPASLTKILTVLVTLQKVRDLDETVTIKRNIHIGRGGVTIGLRKGDRITVRDLCYASMLHSANDACVALAEHISGSVEAFAKQMNLAAKRIGVINSRFVNPNGMPDGRHHSTAYDLAVLATEAMRNPLFAKIVGTKTYTVTVHTVKETRATKKTAKKLGVKAGTLLSSEPYAKRVNVKNRHKLLGKYAGIRGIKTGYTLAAGKCLATCYHSGGRDLIAVVLKAQDAHEDTVNLLAYQKERERLDAAPRISALAID